MRPDDLHRGGLEYRRDPTRIVHDRCGRGIQRDPEIVADELLGPDLHVGRGRIDAAGSHPGAIDRHVQRGGTAALDRGAARRRSHGGDERLGAADVLLLECVAQARKTDRGYDPDEYEDYDQFYQAEASATHKEPP